MLFRTRLVVDSNTFVDLLLFRPLTGRKKIFSPLLCVIGNGQKYVTFFSQNRLNLSYFRSTCDKKYIMFSSQKLIISGISDTKVSLWETNMYISLRVFKSNGTLNFLNISRCYINTFAAFWIQWASRLTIIMYGELICSVDFQWCTNVLSV